MPSTRCLLLPFAIFCFWTTRSLSSLLLSSTLERLQQAAELQRTSLFALNSECSSLQDLVSDLPSPLVPNSFLELRNPPPIPNPSRVSGTLNDHYPPLWSPESQFLLLPIQDLPLLRHHPTQSLPQLRMHLESITLAIYEMNFDLNSRTKTTLIYGLESTWIGWPEGLVDIQRIYQLP
jgi:hypothetical protein